MDKEKVARPKWGGVRPGAGRPLAPARIWGEIRLGETFESKGAPGEENTWTITGLTAKTITFTTSSATVIVLTRKGEEERKR